MKKVQANIEGKTYLFELSRADGGLRVKRDDVEHAATWFGSKTTAIR